MLTKILQIKKKGGKKKNRWVDKLMDGLVNRVTDRQEFRTSNKSVNMMRSVLMAFPDVRSAQHNVLENCKVKA
jgi:hypothetical protein